MGSDKETVKMSGQFKTEVTRGTFDPRTYKTVDKDNWARKRKPEWMSTTGQIHFVRERQVPVVTPTKEEEVMPESRAVTPTKEVKAPAPAVTSVKKAEEERHHQGGRGQRVLWEDRLDTWPSYDVLQHIESSEYLSGCTRCYFELPIFL